MEPWSSGGSNNSIIRPPFLAARPENNNPLNFLYYYNFDDQHQGCLEQVEAHPGMMMMEPAVSPHVLTSHHNMENANPHDDLMMSTKSGHNSYGGNVQDLKKKRLNDEQLDALERNFREEIKLDPERKMRLARELGMQPRQIAVWFQNRRARWKNKQLERMYDALKQEFDVVSREKLRLQEEVMKLRGMVRDRLAASAEDDATGDRDNVLGPNKLQQPIMAGPIAHQQVLHPQMAGGETTHFSAGGANMGQDYTNSHHILASNYWASTQQQQQPPHYP